MKKRTINRRFLVPILLSSILFGFLRPLTSQNLAAKSGGEAIPNQKVSNRKSTNLKVLPKDISPEELNRVMHSYERGLGVPCAYCHEENPQTRQIDFASDENPIKQTARFMISMTNDLNTKYLGQLGDRRYAEPLTCGNCHQGQVSPPVFGSKEAR